MPFSRTPLSVPEGADCETTAKAERLDFEEEGGGVFIVLHFEAPATGRPARIRVPITRAVYNTYR